jgi:hypothetical protein
MTSLSGVYMTDSHKVYYGIFVSLGIPGEYQILVPKCCALELMGYAFKANPRSSFRHRVFQLGPRAILTIAPRRIARIKRNSNAQK